MEESEALKGLRDELWRIKRRFEAGRIEIAEAEKRLTALMKRQDIARIAWDNIESAIKSLEKSERCTWDEGEWAS